MTSRGQLRLVYGVTLGYFAVFGLFLAALQRFVTEELRLGEGTVGIAVGSFAVSALLLRPLIGRQIDRRGRRGFMLGALASQVLLALAFPLADAAVPLVALRLLQGVGHAALYVALTSIVVDLAPPGRRASEVSRLSLFLYAGLGIGPPLAEWLIPRVGFDGTWVAAAGVLLAALLGALVITETGAAVPSGTPSPGPVRSRSLGPRLPPGVLGPGVMILFPSVGYAAIVGFATLYAETLGMGESAGLLYAVFAATVLVVRLVAGRLADHFGNLAIVMPGLGATVSGLLSLAFVPSALGAIAGVMLFGTGFALIFPALLTLSVTAVPDAQRAEAVAAFTLFTDVGIGAGSYLIGLLVSQWGFPAAFTTTAAGCVISILSAVRRARTAPARTGQPTA